MHTRKEKETKSATRRPQPDAAEETHRDQVVDDQAVCQKAPEWAEHQRLADDDEPCDDGRSGRLKETDEK